MDLGIPRYRKLVDAGAVLSTAFTWDALKESSPFESIGSFEDSDFSFIDYASGEQPRLVQIRQQALIGQSGVPLRKELSKDLELFLVTLLGDTTGAGKESLAEEIVDWMLSIQTIRGIYLNGFASSDPLFSEPDRLQTLEELGFHSTEFSQTGISVLGTLQSVKLLILSECSLPDPSVSFLRSMRNLECLDLSTIAHPRDLLGSLERLKRLRYVALNSRHLTPSEKTYLSSCLPNCQIDYGSSSIDQTV